MYSLGVADQAENEPASRATQRETPLSLAPTLIQGYRNDAADNVNIDLSVRAAYVEYAPGPLVETVNLNETLSVACDLDAAGNVIGIKVLGIGRPEQIPIVRELAQSRVSVPARLDRQPCRGVTANAPLAQPRQEDLTRKKRKQRAAKAAGRCGVCATKPVNGKGTCDDCNAAIVAWQLANGWP
jgi:uncharacterized protein YuzE